MQSKLTIYMNYLKKHSPELIYVWWKFNSNCKYLVSFALNMSFQQDCFGIQISTYTAKKLGE